MTRSPCSAGELACPQLISNAPYSLPRCLDQSALPLFASTATSWPVPYQAITISPSLTGLGVDRLCLSWTGTRGPSAASSCCPPPHAVAPTIRGQGKGDPAGLRLTCTGEIALTGVGPLTRDGWLPGRRAVVPIWLVTNTWGPTTTGVDTPAPGNFWRHATPSLSDHVPGRPVSLVTPVPAGPRSEGQSSLADRETHKMAEVAAAMSENVRSIELTTTPLRRSQSRARGSTTGMGVRP